MTDWDDETPAPGYDPTGPAPTLLRLALVARSADVLQALRWARQAGPFDWTTPAQPDGDDLLTAWMDNTASSSRSSFPLTAIEAFDAWSQGQAWVRPNAQGEHLFERWLRAHSGYAGLDHETDEVLAAVVQRSDPARLKTWHTGLLDPVDERTDRPADERQSLISHLLDRVALHTLHAAFGQGLTLLGPNPATGQPVAAAMRHTALWTAYLDQGGDPCAPVFTEDSTVPLWVHLRKHPVSPHTPHLDATRLRTLKATVEAWAQEHAPEELHRIELQEYWEAMDDTGIDGSTMKARNDWPVLRDAEGRSPMMVLVQRHGKFMKEFWTIKKAASAFAALDQNGRSLWFYAMAHRGHDLPEGAVAWLAANVPLQPDRQGWVGPGAAMHHEPVVVHEPDGPQGP